MFELLVIFFVYLKSIKCMRRTKKFYLCQESFFPAMMSYKRRTKTQTHQLFKANKKDVAVNACGLFVFADIEKDHEKNFEAVIQIHPAYKENFSLRSFFHFRNNGQENVVLFQQKNPSKGFFSVVAFNLHFLLLVG